MSTYLFAYLFTHNLNTILTINLTFLILNSHFIGEGNSPILNRKSNNNVNI
jgi:hypothetical protein